MFSKKTVCFVTGASQGLGESISVVFAQKLTAGSVVVLLARNEVNLQVVKDRILQKSPQVKVVVRRFDQSSQNQQVFQEVFSPSLASIGAKVDDFQQVILVNNAGSLKPTKYTRNLPAVPELTEHLQINVSGVIALTSEFLKFVPASLGISRTIINITSIAALQPFKSWPLYCSGKAARDMFFKVVASEEEDVRVLSYAPGPLQTDMTDEVTNSEDEGVSTWMKGAIAEKSLLPCDVSTAKLVQILEKNTFESGAHLDYYDEI